MFFTCLHRYSPSTPFHPLPSTLPSFDKFIEAAAAFAETLKEQIPRKRKTNRKQTEKVAIKEDSSSSSCILLVVGMDCWVFHDSLWDVCRSESTSIKTATDKISQSRIWMLFSRHNCLGWGHHPRIIHEHHFIWYDFVSTKQIKSWIKNSSICTSNGHSVSLSVMPTDIWSNFIYSPKTAISTTMGISTELDKETTQEHLSFCATYVHPAIKGSTLLSNHFFETAASGFHPSDKSIKGGKCSGFPFVKSWWRKLWSFSLRKNKNTHKTQPWRRMKQGGFSEWKDEPTNTISWRSAFNQLWRLTMFDPQG